MSLTNTSALGPQLVPGVGAGSVVGLAASNVATAPAYSPVQAAAIPNTPASVVPTFGGSPGLSSGLGGLSQIVMSVSQMLPQWQLESSAPVAAYGANLVDQFNNQNAAAYGFTNAAYHSLNQQFQGIQGAQTQDLTNIAQSLNQATNRAAGNSGGGK